MESLIKRVLNDFIISMREHDMPEEISAYRVDDHLKQAMEEIELEVGKLSSWIES